MDPKELLVFNDVLTVLYLESVKVVGQYLPDLYFPNLCFNEVICKIEYDGCHHEVDHQLDLEQVMEIRHGFESVVAHSDLVECTDAIDLVVEHLPVAKSPVRDHQTY